MKKGFENIRDVNRREYLKLVLEEVRKEFGVSLISFIVYGSVARGDDDKLSDVDVLLILDTSESYSERCSRLAKILTKIYAHKLTLKLIEEGYNVFIEFYPLSLNEALNFRPIYVVDNVLIEIVKSHNNPRFCMGCSSIRVSYDGFVKTCLFKSPVTNIFDVVKRRDAQELVNVFKWVNMLREPRVKEEIRL